MRFCTQQPTFFAIRDQNVEVRWHARERKGACRFENHAKAKPVVASARRLHHRVRMGDKPDTPCVIVVGRVRLDIAQVAHCLDRSVKTRGRKCSDNVGNDGRLRGTALGSRFAAIPLDMRERPPGGKLGGRNVYTLCRLNFRQSQQHTKCERKQRKRTQNHASRLARTRSERPADPSRRHRSLGALACMTLR